MKIIMTRKSIKSEFIIYSRPKTNGLSSTKVKVIKLGKQEDEKKKIKKIFIKTVLR